MERLNRDVLSSLRAMLAELYLGPQDWTSVIDSFASAINETPLTRLGKNSDGTTRSPLEVFTGTLHVKHFYTVQVFFRV